MAQQSEAKEPQQKLFSTSPQPIVVYEEQEYDEPVIDRVVDPDTGMSTGIRKMIGRNKGKSLHCRGELAHIEGRTAYPIDGSDALPYGPGKAGCWGRNVHGGR